jgi:hypothetical protein
VERPSGIRGEVLIGLLAVRDARFYGSRGGRGYAVQRTPNVIEN